MIRGWNKPTILLWEYQHILAKNSRWFWILFFGITDLDFPLIWQSPRPQKGQGVESLHWIKRKTVTSGPHGQTHHVDSLLGLFLHDHLSQPLLGILDLLVLLREPVQAGVQLIYVVPELLHLMPSSSFSFLRLE